MSLINNIIISAIVYYYVSPRLERIIHNEESGAIHNVSIFLCEGLNFPVEMNIKVL